MSTSVMLTSAGPSQLSLTNAISVRTVAGERELRHSDASLCMRHGDTLQVSAHSASCHKIGRLWRCDLACSSRESGLIRAWSSRSRSQKTLWPQNTTASVAHAVRLAAAPAAAPSLPWLKYARRSQAKLRRCRLATRECRLLRAGRLRKEANGGGDGGRGGRKGQGPSGKLSAAHSDWWVARLSAM